MSKRSRFHLISFILAGAVALGSGSPVYVRAAGAGPTAETGNSTADSSGEDTSGAQAENSTGSTKVLLPSAGFSYSFSAKKVSLRDVEDHLYENGTISEKKSSDTSLTPVQQQEQKVVQAVSETQGIEINNATATILSATAVTVVSDAQTAVSLAKLADKKETQAKLDQGVITAGEAEALMATNKASNSISVNVGNDSADGSSSGTTEVVISIDPGTGDGEAASGAAAAGTESSEAAGEGSSEAGADGDGTTAAGADGSAAAESDPAAADSQEAANSSDFSADASSESSTEGTSAATDSNGNELVVAQVNDYINIRADADQDSDVVGKLYNGSVARVLGRTGNGWARIESGDVKGFIREEYVATGETAQKLADSVSTEHAVVTTETLRVRAAAEGDSDVITLIGDGQKFDILGEENGWYKVSTPDGVGYISSGFADVEKTYPEAVSKQQEEAEEAAKKAEEEAAAKASSEAAEKAASDDAAKAEKASGSSSDSATEASSSSASESADTAETSSKKSPDSGSSLNSYTGSSSAGTSAGQAVVNYAMQFIGNPYVWGGSSLTNGTDCSGFTMAVYANFGYSLPHYTGSQESCGTAVASLADAQPGDLILYDGHVGIYMGNNQIVHASNPRTGITTGTATYRHIVAIRRIIN